MKSSIRYPVLAQLVCLTKCSRGSKLFSGGFTIQLLDSRDIMFIKETPPCLNTPTSAWLCGAAGSGSRFEPWGEFHYQIICL